MTKIYATYEKILDNIYEFLEEHINYFKQHLKILYTIYDKNLYNMFKKLYNIYEILKQHMTHFTQHMITN